MEILLSDELRLVYVLLLLAAVLAGAWRFVSRRVFTDWADRAADVLLLVFLVQYLSVVIPGWAGVLNPLTIAISAVALSAALFFAPGPRLANVLPAETANAGTARVGVLAYGRADLKKSAASGRGRSPRAAPFISWTLLICTLFGAGFLIAVAWNQRHMPVTADDAITYHFPAAVQWLRTGRLSIFQTWFFNPANTYSPLGGSTFIAWWIAPLGNDVLARHVQIPALLLIFFAAVRLMRVLGTPVAVAALIALGLVLSKPFLRQAEIEKDDLYLAAFFACAAAGFARDRLRDPLGPWRIGVALGLMLATKYTALLALPALALVPDAPYRARWPTRQYLIAICAVLLIGGPWYLRNWILTGNPLYPVEIRVLGMKIFGGLMTTARSRQFSSLGQMWELLTGRAQSLPAIPLILLLITLLASWARRWGRVRSEPLVRLCLIGPAIAILIFFLVSPYPEVRFLEPAFILLFACFAIAVSAWTLPPAIAAMASALLLVVSFATAFSFDAQFVAVVGELAGIALLLTAMGTFIVWILRRATSKRSALVGYGSLVLALVAAEQIYTGWSAYMINTCRNSAYYYYSSVHGATGDVWNFVREKLPSTETLAYTNTFLIHPMSGFNYQRRLIYVPTRRGVTHLRDLPPLHQTLSGEDLVPAVAADLTGDTDEDGWLKKLDASGATHLVIFDHAVVKNPPEIAIVRKHPEKFEQVFQNEAGTVYRIRK